MAITVSYLGSLKFGILETLSVCPILLMMKYLISKLYPCNKTAQRYNQSAEYTAMPTFLLDIAKRGF